jgi:hypothetical protein
MDSEELKKAIVEFGKEGVLRYREISQSKHDNELPEVFLGSFIGPQLYDKFRYPIQVEKYYSVLAQDAHLLDSDGSLLTELGGLRADLVMYPPNSPAVIIELKIFDESTQSSSIANDLSKMTKLTKSGKFRGYVAVLICEKSRKGLIDRIRDLQEALQTTIYSGPAVQSATGNWEWCFGCAAFEQIPT